MGLASLLQNQYIKTTLIKSLFRFWLDNATWPCRIPYKPLLGEANV